MSKKTGLYYAKNEKHKHPSPGARRYHPLTSSHFENPKRIEEIKEKFDEYFHANLEIRNKYEELEEREASKKELMECHDEEYIELVKNNKIGNIEGVVFANEHTYKSACLAVGGVISLVEKVVDGSLTNGFALIRPPGHHSDRFPDMTKSGFCIFNNVAIAAKLANKKYGMKVAVIDWDFHHGNGTNNLLNNESEILFISVHRYGKIRRENVFPQTGSFGEKDVKNIINIPVSYGYNDQDMYQIFSQIVIPVCREFNPGLIIVSAGFDIYSKDKAGDCNVSKKMFGYLTWLLKGVNPRLILALEGGYSSGTKLCCLECLKVLVGNEPDKKFRSDVFIKKSLGKLLRKVKMRIHKLWNCIDEPEMIVKKRDAKKKKKIKTEIIMNGNEKIEDEDEFDDEKEEETEVVNIEKTGGKRKVRDNDDIVVPHKKKRKLD